jgi:cytoskeletal protein CcmA (bactofilin family)
MEDNPMARTPFGTGKGGDRDSQSIFTPPAPSSSSSSGSSSPGGLTAFIDQGSEFEGKLSFKDTVRIDGRFRGEISSENTLIVGESGEIEATIHSKAVSISGTVVGDVVASSKVVLHKTGRIDGNIETDSIVVDRPRHSLDPWTSRDGRHVLRGRGEPARATRAGRRAAESTHCDPHVDVTIRWRNHCLTWLRPDLRSATRELRREGP